MIQKNNSNRPNLAHIVLNWVADKIGLATLWYSLALVILALSTIVFFINPFRPEIAKLTILGGPEELTFNDISETIVKASSIDSLSHDFSYKRASLPQVNLVGKENTSGSQANLQQIAADDQDGHVLGLIHANASCIDCNIEGVRAIANVQESVLHIISSDLDLMRITDIDSTVTVLFVENSGAMKTAIDLMDHYKINYKSKKLSSFKEVKKQLELDNYVTFLLGGVPLGFFERLKTQVNFLELENIEALVNKFPYFKKCSIPSGTYYFEDRLYYFLPEKSTETISVNTILVASRNLEDKSYLIKKFLENLYLKKFEFAEVHPALNFDKNFAVEEPLVFDLHSGSKEYFLGKESFFDKISLLGSPVKNGLIALGYIFLIPFIVLRIKFSIAHNRIFRKVRVILNDLSNDEILKSKKYLRDSKKALMRHKNDLLFQANLCFMSLSMTNSLRDVITEGIRRCDHIKPQKKSKDKRRS